MCPVRREWLVHGCMKLSDEDKKERVSLKARSLISQMYEGEEFSIKSWPQRGFRDTLWWYEKSIEAPGSAASYFLSLDNRRGPNLYAGVAVEKAYEDDELARQSAIEHNNQPLGWWHLDESWDWNKLVSSLSQVEPLALSAAEALQRELYLSLEFGEGGLDSQHYVLTQGRLYWRGGFKPVEWVELHKFIIQPRPQSWGGVSLVRAFTLDECTPHLDEARLMEVFRAMRPIRDLWRGRGAA